MTNLTDRMTLATTAKVLLLSTILISLTSQAHTQPAALTPTELQHVDSLFQAVELDQARAFLTQKEDQLNASGADDEVWTAYRQQTEGYAGVLDAITSVTSREDAFIRDYAMQRVVLREQFQPLQAGEQAAALYDAFERHIRASAFTEAVIHFEVARFVKRAYVEEVQRELVASYARARRAQATDDYEAASSIIDSVRVYFSSTNAAHRPVINQFAEFDVEVTQFLTDEARQERHWGRTERSSFSFGLSVNSQIATRGAVGPLTLPLLEASEPFPYDGFAGTSVFSYGLEAYAYLNQNLTLGGGFALTSNRFDNRTDQEAIFLDVVMKSRTAYAVARYAFRSEVGVRPYLRVGGGLIQTQRELSDATLILVTPDDERIVLHFTLAEESRTGAQLMAGVGFEYIPCATCKLMIGGEIGALRNFIDTDFLPNGQIGAGLRAGINL